MGNCEGRQGKISSFRLNIHFFLNFWPKKLPDRIPIIFSDHCPLGREVNPPVFCGHFLSKKQINLV